MRHWFSPEQRKDEPILDSCGVNLVTVILTLWRYYSPSIRELLGDGYHFIGVVIYQLSVPCVEFISSSISYWLAHTLGKDFHL